MIIKPFRFEIPMIDTWTPGGAEDIIFTNMKNFVVAPISKHMNLNSDSLDYFMIKAKKCYNSQGLRDHLCQVLNYFEKYFDPDKELLACMSHIKYMIDTFAWYNIDNFMNDVKVYILGNSLKEKVVRLADYNYKMDLTYKNISAPLQYTNDHAKIMLEMSILMNFVIPLITHFAHKRRVGQIDEFILDVYDLILNMFPADIFSKIYETAISNVGKSEYKNAPLWAKQDIRGKDVVTHSRDSVDNIILNIMPKYAFERNIVALNFTSIGKNTSCQILDIGYEYGFVSLSSSKRDGEDNLSETDRRESVLLKQNEALAIQASVAAEETMKVIDSLFGPFNDEEIEFHRNALKNDVGNFQNPFQKQLIHDLFYKYFGDTEVIHHVKQPSVDYIKLMLAGRKILEQSKMVIMPYVISGKIEKLVPRKTINKKEEKEMIANPLYPLLVEKYGGNKKVMDQILSMFATVISSNFRIIDYRDSSLHGKVFDTNPSIVMNELIITALLF